MDDAALGWQTLDRRNLISDRWLEVDALRVRTGRGIVLDPYYMIREADWACAIPLLEDGRIVLVAQYRPGPERVTLELPAGDIEAGEEPATAVLRELEEETGCRACGPAVPLPALYPDPSRNCVRGHGFVVPVAPGGNQRLEDGEDIRIEYLDLPGIEAAIADGRFRHAAHLAWLLMARERGLLAGR